MPEFLLVLLDNSYKNIVYYESQSFNIQQFFYVLIYVLVHFQLLKLTIQVKKFYILAL